VINFVNYLTIFEVLTNTEIPTMLAKIQGREAQKPLTAAKIWYMLNTS
jgi:hypothetical protein